MYPYFLSFAVWAMSGSVEGFTAGDPCLTPEMETVVREQLEPLRGRTDGILILGSSDKLEYRREQDALRQPGCVTLPLSPEIRAHHRLGLLRASAVFEVCRRMELPQCLAEPILAFADGDGATLMPAENRVVLSTYRTRDAGSSARHVRIETFPPQPPPPPPLPPPPPSGNVLVVKLPPLSPPPLPPPDRRPTLLRVSGGGLLALSVAELVAGGVFLHLAGAQRAATLESHDAERSLLLEEDGYRYARAGIACTAIGIATFVTSVALFATAKHLEKKNKGQGRLAFRGGVPVLRF